MRRRMIHGLVRNLQPAVLTQGGAGIGITVKSWEITAGNFHPQPVAGPEHVGLGSDFDGVLATPEGLDDVRDLPKITAGLAEDGLTDEDLRSVLGGNFRRVLSDVLP